MVPGGIMGRLLGFVVLLLALALGLLLFTGKTEKDIQTVSGFRLHIPEHAPPTALDWNEAARAVALLESMVAKPEIPGTDLERVATQAIGWVAGSQPGSAEYRLAVSLRAACLALSQADTDLSNRKRQEARGHLAKAREVLSGAPSGGFTRAIQDQLTNLQVQQGEELQKMEKELP